MNLLPKSHEEFSQKEYWDSFFKKRGTKAFEWYGEYPELSEYLHKYIKQQDDILITGCGNSTLGQDLYDIGFSKITSIDISSVVIRQLMLKNPHERPNLKYLQMDALAMSFESDSFSVVLDKGTLDALMPDNSESTIEKIKQYFNEITRVLKAGGRYICISLLQEHILKIILDYFTVNNFIFRAVRCYDAEKKAVENGENPMPVFLTVCTKFKTLSVPILELDLTSSGKLQRFSAAKEIIEQIGSVQHAAFVLSGLKRSSLGNESEVTFHLYQMGLTTPRYSVYVVDTKREHKNSEYAAFIVPQGREVEWLFSTKSGRQHLIKVTNTNRLAIVTMHRGQQYGNFEEVQNELSDAICNLAPANLRNKKIMFLSLGSDVGKRTVRHEGCSKFSGSYVIEDVEIDSKDKFRRLFYLNSQQIIQSEAKLKTVKVKKGFKETVDLTHLTCKHHIYMSVATRVACKSKEGSVAVIGLGGGGLCSFLCKFLPKFRFVGVDIDEDMLKVATDWFGLTLDNNLNVVIQDGLQFLNESADKNEKFDAILFDVDSKDSRVGMSCPPKEFLESKTLGNIVKIIKDEGFFILNLVLREETLRPSIVRSLKNKFKTIISYQLQEDLNEVFICAVKALDIATLKANLAQASSDINLFFKKNASNSGDNIEIEDYLSSLVII